MSDFIPALTHQIKWSVGENRFDESGKQPKQLSLFVSKESILEFASYLQRLAGETDRIKTGKIWDFTNKEEIEVDGFYLNGKGQSGQYGDFGSINLNQIPGSDANQPQQANACGITPPDPEPPARWDTAPLQPDTDDIPF